MTNSELPRTAVPAGITDPVLAARAELKAALAAIEIKGNVPRKLDRAFKRAAVKARRNPAAAVAVAVAAAAVAGSLVWVIARAVSR